jgi:hypothetical protein
MTIRRFSLLLESVLDNRDSGTGVQSVRTDGQKADPAPSEEMKMAVSASEKPACFAQGK